jgi:hypothetical protein
MPITHPLKKGTKVTYLSPRCACSGSKWKLVESTVIGINKQNKNIMYSIRGEKHKIPIKGIIKVV